MRIASYALLFTLLSLAVGCCQPWEQPQQPRPRNVPGWKKSQIHTVQILGEFVLKKGESTESDKLGVKVVDISPLVTCVGFFLSEPPAKEVVLNFYEPSTQKELCETTVREGSGDLPCPNGGVLPSLSVNEINTKEGWVWLVLKTTVGDERW